MPIVSNDPSLFGVASWIEFFAPKLAHHKVTTSYYIDSDINLVDYSLKEKSRHF
jgi:hypothetical protein